MEFDIDKTEYLQKAERRRIQRRNKELPRLTDEEIVALSRELAPIVEQEFQNLFKDL